MEVMVVGANSLIASALGARMDTASWRFVGHDAALASHDLLQGVDVLINCAFDPRLKAGAYDSACDFDLSLAEMLREWPAVHYVMLSSRLAYGPARGGGRLVETLACAPDRPYGVAKYTTEQSLGRALGTRLTVLRLANVFGDELRPGRQSFFAMALRTLRDEGRIVLDMSPFVERDFIPAEEVAAALVRVARAPRPGLFNLGAGHGTPTGRIAQWLIEGHGSGELVSTSPREFDPFWLDMSASGVAFGIERTPAELLRQRCQQLGERLRRGALGRP